MGPQREDRDDDALRVLDWDGDGRDDLAMVDSAFGRNHIAVLRFKSDGTLEDVNTGITAGASASGPAAAGGCSCQGCYCDSGPGQPPTCFLSPACLGDPDPQEPGFPGYHLSQTLDVNGDGLTDFVQFDPDTSQLVVHIRQGGKADMLSNVTSGLGSQTGVAYRHIGDRFASFYTPNSGSCPADMVCAKSGVWAVSAVTRDNGAPTYLGWLTTHYTYADARYSRTGWGFLGFGQRTESTSRAVGSENIDTSKAVIYKSFAAHERFLPFVGIVDWIETTVRRKNATGEPIVGIRHRTTRDPFWTYTGKAGLGQGRILRDYSRRPSRRSASNGSCRELKTQKPGLRQTLNYTTIQRSAGSVTICGKRAGLAWVDTRTR